MNSPIGPAPGYVTGGANASFSVGSLSPPSGQPAQKSYLDFNDGYPLRSWEITEPAIYYQAVYLRLLAHRVDTASSIITHTTSLAPTEWAVQVYPNPSSDEVHLTSSATLKQLTLYSSDGRQLWTMTAQPSFSIAELPVGTYVLIMENLEGKEHSELLL